jgi:hypothetical protein
LNARFYRGRADDGRSGSVSNPDGLLDVQIGNPRNGEAAFLASELLTNNRWCYALSPELHYPGVNNPLVSASFTPEGQLCAVSSDGKLLGWGGEDTQLTPRQLLVAADTEKRVGNSSLPVTFVASASFSPDGQQLLVIPPPMNVRDPSKKIPFHGAVSEGAPTKTETSDTSNGRAPMEMVQAQIWQWSKASRAYEPIG